MNCRHFIKNRKPNDMQDLEQDIEFLTKMKELSSSLMERYDVTKLQYLDKMIEDWLDELKKKKR